MRVYRRTPDGPWWVDFAVGGQRHRYSTGQLSHAEARSIGETHRAALVRAALVGAPPPRAPNAREPAGGDRPVQLTVADFAARRWKAGWAELRSAPTIALRLEVLARCLGPAWARPLVDLTHEDVAAAIERRRGEPIHQAHRRKAARLPANATVNRDILDTLRPIVRLAAARPYRIPEPEIDWGRLRLREPPERHVRLTSALTEQARESLLPHYRDLFAFFERYGLRLREAWFRLDHIDLDAGTVWIASRKGGGDHVIPLLPEDLAQIRARVGRARAAGLDTVWFRENRWTGELEAISPRAYQSHVKQRLTAMGLGHVRPAHELRHKAGDDITRAAGIVQAKHLLGHASITTTQRYAKSSLDDVRAGLARAAAPAGDNPAEGASNKNVLTGLPR